MSRAFNRIYGFCIEVGNSYRIPLNAVPNICNDSLAPVLLKLQLRAVKLLPTRKIMSK